jgi:hypothetical protein
MDGGKKSATSAAADLTDDLIVEILSRLPAKSICRFKCVSRHWYGLITHPEHRRKIPQTLSGFFHPSYRFWLDNEDLKILPGFVDMREGEDLPFPDPSLPFLTGYRLIIPKVCCNGLLFCLCRKAPPVMKPNLLYAILQQRNGLSCQTQTASLCITFLVLTRPSPPTSMCLKL